MEIACEGEFVQCHGEHAKRQRSEAHADAEGSPSKKAKMNMHDEMFNDLENEEDGPEICELCSDVIVSNGKPSLYLNCGVISFIFKYLKKFRTIINLLLNVKWFFQK